MKKNEEEDIDSSQTEPESRMTPVYKQALAVSGVIFYAIGSGANLAFPGVLLQQLRANDTAITLERHHESWIASLLGLAILVGSASAPLCLQRLGRKTTNQVSSVPALAGWLLMMAATNPEQLMASRLLQGFGMGIQNSAGPISIAEYSSPGNRGAFLATIAFSLSAGMLLAHVLGTLLYWRSASLACGSVYIISFILICLVPESPSWLASRGLFDRCRKSFIWLRGTDLKSNKELEILINSQRKVSQVLAPKKSFKYYLSIVRKPEFYKPTLIMILMFALFQASGLTVIPAYSVEITNEITNSSIEPDTAMLVIDSVRFITACLSCAVINKYPRRSVLFFGCFICILGLLATSLTMYLRDYGFISERLDWIPMVPTLVYMFGQTIGILPIPWAIAGEIFPLQYRSIGSGVSGVSLPLMLFLIVKTAPASFVGLGVHGTFLVYALCLLICAAVLYYLLPETKGKTLYDIECYFKGVHEDMKVDSDANDKILEMTLIGVDKNRGIEINNGSGIVITK